LISRDSWSFSPGNGKYNKVGIPGKEETVNPGNKPFPIHHYYALLLLQHLTNVAHTTHFSGDLIPLEDLSPEEAAMVAAERERWT
jgi:hypothetical protein